MGMTPIDYFESFVLENYQDFADNEWCVRRGFNAAVSAFQMADHIYNYCERHAPERVSMYPQKKDYFDYLYDKSGAFKDIRAVANAYKHLYTRGTNAVVSSTGAVELEFSDGDMSSVDTDDEGSREYVVYEKRTGERLELKTTLETVLDLWREELGIS